MAFIIDDRFIILTEHQSTLSPNLSLRMLCYLGREYEKTAFSRTIYSTRLKKIPTPELYVFYDGMKDAPAEWEMKLSDAFTEKCDTITVEAVVKVINVSYEKGAELLARCRTMREYSLFMQKIKERLAVDDDIEAAVTETIRECIESDILAEYLMNQRGDIMSVLEVNLTMEEREEIRWQDGYEEATYKLAKKFKDSGVSVAVIAENTGLSVEEVEEL